MKRKFSIVQYATGSMNKWINGVCVRLPEMMYWRVWGFFILMLSHRHYIQFMYILNESRSNCNFRYEQLDAYRVQTSNGQNSIFASKTMGKTYSRYECNFRHTKSINDGTWQCVEVDFEWGFWTKTSVENSIMNFLQNEIYANVFHC